MQKEGDVRLKESFYVKTNSILIHVLLAPSPDLSEGSISPAEVKRTIKIKYFLGEGSKEWKPKEEVNKCVDTFS